jgi:hypothetical protein
MGCLWKRRGLAYRRESANNLEEDMTMRSGDCENRGWRGNRSLPIAVLKENIVPLPLHTLILATLLLPLGGCGEKESAPELVTLEGKIEKIERTSDKAGKVTVVYYNERQKQEMTGSGSVTAETEIMIDGAVATLADLREGERVRGDVRVEKKGGKKIQTIVKIVADRAKTGGTGN